MKNLMFGMFTEEEWKEFVKSKQWKKELKHRAWNPNHKWLETDDSLQISLFEQPKERNKNERE